MADPDPKHIQGLGHHISKVSRQPLDCTELMSRAWPPVVTSIGFNGFESMNLFRNLVPLRSSRAQSPSALRPLDDLKDCDYMTESLFATRASVGRISS